MSIWRKPKTRPAPPPEPKFLRPGTRREDATRDGGELRLGRGVHVRGKLNGARDVRLEGTAEGQVNLPDHALTVGPTALVRAEVFAKRVVVEGKLTGNVVATDTAIITSTGAVSGNVFAPRVVLADGCIFEGGVNHDRTTPAESPSDCAAFWTMAYPDQEQPSEPKRLASARRRPETGRTGARPSLVEQSFS